MALGLAREVHSVSAWVQAAAAAQQVVGMLVLELLGGLFAPGYASAAAAVAAVVAESVVLAAEPAASAVAATVQMPIQH